MSQLSSYLPEDIKNFLLVHQEEQNSEQSKSLKKLLSVQDKISIFKNINPEELKAIVYDLKFIRAARNDLIIKENDESRDIFFIIDGKCEVLREGNKLGTLRPGEIFGESGAIFHSKRNANVVCASEEVKLLSFKIDENNLEFCSVALATLYKNLAHEINAKLEEINYAYIIK
jgi:CRP-like cAMP-binding protein